MQYKSISHLYIYICISPISYNNITVYLVYINNSLQKYNSISVILLFNAPKTEQFCVGSFWNGFITQPIELLGFFLCKIEYVFLRQFPLKEKTFIHHSNLQTFIHHSNLQTFIHLQNWICFIATVFLWKKKPYLI